MALNIPIVPLIVGHLGPEESEAIPLAENLQAIRIGEDCSDLDTQLGQANLEYVVFPPYPRPRSVLVEIGEWHENRTELMARYAERVIELGEFGMLRQRGALSSFCIPSADIREPIWHRREGDKPRSGFLRTLQRSERVALERHARTCGCRLIIDEKLSYAERDFDSLKARLETLLEFMESMEDEKLQVVSRLRENEGNLTIVGDWFVADSLVPVPGAGYRQTIFTWHAPTVLSSVRAFDEQFRSICSKQGIDPRHSRRTALSMVKRRLSQLSNNRMRINDTRKELFRFPAFAVGAAAAVGLCLGALSSKHH